MTANIESATVVPLPASHLPAAHHPPAHHDVRPRTHRVHLHNLCVDADIGFHDFEIGTPQRLLISVDVTLDLAQWPRSDTREEAWNYDFIREGILTCVAARRYNLQETLVQEIFAMIARCPGVIALSISSRKPDVYPDAQSVGITLSSE